GEKYRDEDFHYLLAGRLYALIANADLNLFYFFSNQYHDLFKNKSRYGISFSRYFLTDYELHVEALFQTGSPRNYPNHACLSGPCAAPFAPTRLDSSAF